MWPKDKGENESSKTQCPECGGPTAGRSEDRDHFMAEFCKTCKIKFHIEQALHHYYSNPY